MGYFLVKTEPGEYSWDDLVREKEGTWDGVRNYQARNFLKEMKKGDRVLIYHSVNDREVVGIAEVTKEAFPDPTTDDERWVAIRLKPVKKFSNPVGLKAIKEDSRLKDIHLVKNSRLSVMPLPREAFDAILNMAV